VGLQQSERGGWVDPGLEGKKKHLLLEGPGRNRTVSIQVFQARPVKKSRGGVAKRARRHEVGSLIPLWDPGKTGGEKCMDGTFFLRKPGGKERSSLQNWFDLKKIRIRAYRLNIWGGGCVGGCLVGGPGGVGVEKICVVPQERQANKLTNWQSAFLEEKKAIPRGRGGESGTTALAAIKKKKKWENRNIYVMGNRDALPRLWRDTAIPK